MLVTSMQNARKHKESLERPRQQLGGQGKTHSQTSFEQHQASFEQHCSSVQSKKQEGFAQYRRTLSLGDVPSQVTESGFAKYRRSLSDDVSDGSKTPKKGTGFSQFRRFLNIKSPSVKNRTSKCEGTAKGDAHSLKSTTEVRQRQSNYLLSRVSSQESL